MLEALDALMEEREMEWLIVTGASERSADMHYLTRGAGIGGGWVFKKRGGAAWLLHNDMERDEAADSGLECISYTDAGWPEIRKRASTPKEAQRQLLYQLCQRLGVTGRIGLYGTGRIQNLYPLVQRLLQETGLKLVEEADLSLLEEARIIKRSDEVDRIRRVGEATEAVVREVLVLLGRCRQSLDGIVDEAGLPVTVGQVKRRVDLEVVKRGLVIDHPTIFAPGAEGGVPHNRGTADRQLKAGQPIVFDIFPREPGGGYWFDMTRTYCLGHVPSQVQEMYDQVLSIHQQVLEALKPDTPARSYDAMTCDHFEALGHPTLRSTPGTQVGYCHSLGHGIGLDLHEPPRLRHLASNPDVLAPGMVFTVEPGLYYPEDGVGIRIEDTVWLRPDGTLENLNSLPKEQPCIQLTG